MAQGTRRRGDGEDAAYQRWLSEMVAALRPNMTPERVAGLHVVRRATGAGS